MQAFSSIHPKVWGLVISPELTAPCGGLPGGENFPHKHWDAQSSFNIQIAFEDNCFAGKVNWIVEVALNFQFFGKPKLKCTFRYLTEIFFFGELTKDLRASDYGFCSISN